MTHRLTGFYRFARGVFRTFMVPWTKIDVEGLDKLPREGGFLLVCNHLSNIDPVCLLWVMMKADIPVRIMAKSELFKVPLLGGAMRQMKLLPVNRRAKDPGAILASAAQALREGECVAIYPEGTLTLDPELWPMRIKTGAARLALDTGAPVIPFIHWGEQKIMRSGSVLIDFRPRRRVQVRIGDPIPLEDLCHESGSADHEAVEEATRRIQRVMIEGVAQLRGEEAPAGVWDRKLKERVDY